LSTLTIGNAETQNVAALPTIGDDVVLGVKGIAIVSWNADAFGTVKSRLRSSTTNNDTGTNRFTFSTYQLYSSAGILLTDPATGARWTESGVNAVQFGVIEGESTDKSRVTFIGVAVAYGPKSGNRRRRVICGAAA
jgi:hypothetical protein